MLNRRRFVHQVGAAVAGSLPLLHASARVRAEPQGQAARPPLPPDAIRIGSNENPYGPTPAVAEAARLAVVEGHRYAFGAGETLLALIAASHRVLQANVILSAGSGDILRASVKAFTSRTAALVTGAPSYEQPVRQAVQSGVQVHEVPLTSDLKLDLPAMLARAPGAGLVYICNPNNPTSTVVPLADVIEVIDAVSKTSPETAVLVDEAYFEYADDRAFGTVIPMLERFPRLVVARTFSKIHGMAGMRLGYAVANEKMLASLREHHSASGISVMTVNAGLAAMKDPASVARNQALNREVREFTTKAFEKAGYRVAASDANFLLVDVRRDVKGFIEGCRQKGVVIGRPFPPLTSWARITIGTRGEMERAMSVFTDVLASPPAPIAGLHPSLSAYWNC